jgi:hypothetical protein
MRGEKGGGEAEDRGIGGRDEVRKPDIGTLVEAIRS